MICKECGRVDGLKILLDKKEIVCKQCLAKINGCKHHRVKVYKDFSTGGSYRICKECGEQNEM
jgi:hypothetical protein